MARKEWTPENWKWDEKKIKKYLEEFEKFLKSEKGQNDVKNRSEKLKMAQELLKDEESIESLTIKNLSSLLKTLDASIRSPVPKKIRENEEYFKEFKAWLKNLINVKLQDPLPEKRPEDVSIGYASELLTLRNPKEFYLINNASIGALRKLGFGKLPSNDEKSYPKWRPLFDELKEKIKPIIENLNRKVDYYDVDQFLYFVSKQNGDLDKIQDKNRESSNIAEAEKKLESERQKEKSKLTLQEFFQYKGFYFDQDLITAFYSALKTKGFVILSGLTGTGKTKLAQLFAELLCPNCFKKQSKEENTQNPQDKQNTQIAQNSSNNQNQCKCTHRFLSVRPDWRDSKALLGYYNPITGNYESTNLLKFILEAIKTYNTKKDNADPYFIILDEMNLSHVEYYFADFLSVLESGRDENKNYLTKETIKLHNRGEEKIQIPEEIELPPNLYIIGSVNIDETTYMFSPKVLDRAFTIEFREVNFDDYSQFEIDKEKAKSIIETIRKGLLEDLRNKKNEQTRFCGAVADKEEIKEALKWIKENKVRSEKSIFDELKELNQILQPYDLHFGYRVLDEIALFIKYATNAPIEVGKLCPEQALDFAVLMKVLPKFHGPRQKLERPLWLVLNWCLENPEKFDHKTLEELIKGIWKKLNGKEERPNAEDLIHVIQELKLNNRSESVSKEANSESQTIDENQNQTKEGSPELTGEAHQTEQTSKTEKTPIINKVKYPRTAIKVLTMLRQLYETGFASFA
jgi:5-methylcytosine-specific restriction endonuclease McrBC GTP-binding regulatory subunit McrB